MLELLGITHRVSSRSTFCPMRNALLLLALVTSVPAAAQAPDRRAPLQSEVTVFLGGGLGPGVGGVAIGSDTVLGLLLREVALYGDYVPRVTGGSGRLLSAVGIGGGLRALRLAAIVADEDVGRFDLDVGARIGPSFYTAFFEQTADGEARAFGIFFDGWARGTARLSPDAVVFAELGTQAPGLRGGLAFPLR